MKKDQKQTKKKQQPKPEEPKTQESFHEPGYGTRTRTCTWCDGTGRGYEGGYGMRDCKRCS